MPTSHTRCEVEVSSSDSIMVEDRPEAGLATRPRLPEERPPKDRPPISERRVPLEDWRPRVEVADVEVEPLKV
jgi:hypothetical protein